MVLLGRLLLGFVGNELGEGDSCSPCKAWIRLDGLVL